MIRLYIIIIIKFLSAFVVTSLWMICRPCCTFKLLAYAKLICMGYRKVVSSSCKNHGIYEYIMRYVYRSSLLICIDPLVFDGNCSCTGSDGCTGRKQISHYNGNIKLHPYISFHISLCSKLATCS